MERLMFCPKCGSYRNVDHCSSRGKIQCSACNCSESLESVAKIVRTNVEVIPYQRSKLLCKLYGQREAAAAAAEAEINEECPKCKHPKLSYHTAQLRSLDEGQTIFYTCLNEQCGHKYTLNS